MNPLNIADNIHQFRHAKKITQEQLADFIGVTKASVSKWETGQSIPDIMLLPQLATFFDTTIDNLLGYQPQLSKEQITGIYQELAADFTKSPYEDTMNKSQKLVKQYYSCYPFLLQIAILWLNHMSLAKTKENQTAVMHSILDLCSHITSDCKDLHVCSDAAMLQSYVNLQLGNAQEVICSLEDSLNPQKLINQSDTLLIQAYVLSGNLKKANSFTQISTYNHLLSLIGNAATYISINTSDLKMCEKTVERIGQIIEIFDLKNLHPNTAGQFYYQAALLYASHNEKKKTLAQLRKCSQCMENILSADKIMLHGDDYFHLIDEYFDESGICTDPPRNRKLIAEDIRNLYDHPSFHALSGEPEFQKLKKALKEVR